MKEYLSEAEKDSIEIAQLMRQEKHSLACMVHTQKFELSLVHAELSELKKEIRRVDALNDALIGEKIDLAWELRKQSNQTNKIKR